MASIISLCDICNLRHLSNPSTHWCQDCDEAHCTECKEHHNLSKATRAHTTIPMADYQKLPAFITDIKPYCEIHNVKYQNYCKKHECPICYKCIQDHVKCIEIIPLEMVIQDSKTSQIFNDLNQSVWDVLTNITQMRKCRENNMTEITDQCKSAVRKIREFRKTFNNHLDCIEQNLMTSLQDVESKYSQKIQEILKRLNEIELDISNFNSTLQGIKQHASEIQAFLATREIEKLVSEKETELYSMVENKVFDDFTVSLEINTMMEKILSDVKIFGTVSVKTVPTNYKLINRKSRQAQIVTNVQSFDDIKLMQIRKFDSGSRKVTGCTFLPDGRMVFTDYEGKRLFITKADGNLDFEIPVKGNKTFAVTVVDATTIAVSSGKPGLYEKACIQIIQTQSREVTKTIYTESWCYGVVCVDEKLLFCGYKPNGIYEIDLKTNQKRVISSTIHLAVWTCIAYFRNKIYVTTENNHTVTCCDYKGNIIWTYMGSGNTKSPHGISVDNNGNVFVASYGSNNVTVISPDGKRAKQILDTKDGLNQPCTLKYDCTTNRLIVANIKGMANVFDAQ